MGKGLAATAWLVMALFATPSILWAQEAKKDENAGDKAAKKIGEWIDKISINGQIRFRGEYRNPVGYGGTAAENDDDDMYLLRTRLNIDVKVKENIKVFAQPQDSRTFGEEASVSSNEKNLDMHQSYVEISDLFKLWGPVSLKIGRQELKYGDGRLISPSDWNNVGRAWDAIKLSHEHHDLKADIFTSVIKENTDANDDYDFSGMYLTYTGYKDYVFDGYLLWRHYGTEDFTGEDGVKGRLNDYTYGVRFNGKRVGFDYSGEFAYQTGDYAEDNVKAFAFAAVIGYTFAEVKYSPRFAFEYDYATGDKDPTDGDRETFDPIFPFAHAYQGYADVFAWKNGADWKFTGSMKPDVKWILQADYHIFKLAEKKDAWYKSDGTAVRRDATGASGNAVGNELDLHAKYAYDDSLSFWMGYSRFFTGNFVRDTGGIDDDMDWLFLQMTVNF